jgi:hypothetical protein
MQRRQRDPWQPWQIGAMAAVLAVLSGCQASDRVPSGSPPAAAPQAPAPPPPSPLPPAPAPPGSGPPPTSGVASPCRDRVPQALRLDEIAPPLGFSPRELLRFAAGSHRLPLEWQPTYAGAGELEFTIEPTDRARFVAGVPGHCFGRVEIDVNVRLTTTDGTVEETFAAKLFGYDRKLARIDHPFDAPAIRRIYARQPPHTLPGELLVTAEFTRYGAGGNLYANPGNVIALWPYTTDCIQGPPVREPRERPLLDEVVDRSRGAGELTYLDRSSVPITITSRLRPGASCHDARPGDEDYELLEVGAELTLTPPTGRPISLTVRLFVRPTPDGTFTGVDMLGTGPCTRHNLLSVDQFLEQCGDWHADLTRFHGAHLEISGGVTAARVLVYGNGGENCRRNPDLGGLFGCSRSDIPMLGEAYFGLLEP